MLRREQRLFLNASVQISVLIFRLPYEHRSVRIEADISVYSEILRVFSTVDYANPKGLPR